MMRKSFFLSLIFFAISMVAFAQSSPTGSPCPDFARPFCTDDNPYGITFPSGTQGNASAFLNSTDISCCFSTPCPAWYYMQIDNPGNLTIEIKQGSTVGGTNHDVDFVCWGPFEATNQADFMNKLCSIPTSYHLGNTNHGNNDSEYCQGYPTEDGVIDCCWCNAGIEYCHINNAQHGQWYLLLITNYSEDPGYITFNRTSSSTATTNCNLLNTAECNSPICEGQTLQLICTAPHDGAIYNWTLPNTAYSYPTQDAVFEIPNATPDMSGEWHMTLSGVSQQSNAAIIDVVVYPTPVSEIVCDHEHVCQGDSIHLSAVDYDPLATYIWSGKPINGTQDYEPVATNILEFDYQPESSTRFVLVATANGCMGVDSFDVAVTPNPNININITKPFICFGDNTSITATGGSYYRWSGGSTSTSASINVSPTMTTDYTVEVTTDAGCKDDTTVTITVNPEITLSYEQYPSYCGLPTGEITMATLGGTPPYTYNSTQVNFVDNIASGLNSGSYGVTMIDAEGCTKSMTAEVGLVPGPEACFIFTSSDDVQMAVANCTPGGTNNNYFWDFGDAVTSTEFNPTHEYPEPGRYSVFMQVEDEHGCIDSLRQDYLINGPVYFPNAFTPNGDGVNDEIGIIGRTIQEEDFLWVVYSRNGQMVFMSTNPTLLWDGNMPNGQKAPSGVYVYSLKYKDVNGNHFERDGSFTLIR